MRSWTSPLRSRRKPIRRHQLGSAFGQLEDRTLLAASLTASMQGNVLDIEGTNGPDTITVRLYNGYYSVDGLSSTFAAANVQSIKIDGLGGDDHINLHTEGPLVTGNKTAFIIPPGGQLPADQPITVPTEIHGGDGNDTIDGGEGPDVIFGEAGNDTIRGWGGANYIDGGLGNDSLYGGDGADTIFGDLGNNYINGGAGYNTIYAGPESNTVVDSPATNMVAGADFIQSIVVDPALREETRYLDNDGVLSRNDMLAIFQIVEAGSTVNNNQLESLRRLDDVGNFLGMPDSVRVLTNKVVNYDAANKTFLQFPLESDGVLHAGDSIQDFDELVAKWYDGSDHPVAQNDTMNKSYDYKPASGTLFDEISLSHVVRIGDRPITVTTTVSEVYYTDVVQGDVGDCYFLASLAGVARSDPQAIMNMFTDNGDGTYTVRLFLKGQADYVTVDRDLPVNVNGQFVFANSGALAASTTNVLWVALAEKAYVEFNASGTIAQDGTNTYQGIAGGYPDIPFTQIAGTADDQHNFGDSGASQADMIAALNAGKVVTWSTQNNPSDADVVPEHVYLVTGYDATTNTFQLYNPWGLAGADYKGHHMPGTLSLTFQQLMDNGDAWYASK